MSSTSGQSNVGNRQLYEAGDQRNPRRDERESHQSLDSKDEQTIANKLAKEAVREKEGEQDSVETQRVKQDPTLPARAHGNEPSRGAKIDAQLQAEEEEYLQNKGRA
jgi:nitrogen fixation protein FixH